MNLTENQRTNLLPTQFWHQQFFDVFYRFLFRTIKQKTIAIEYQFQEHEYMHNNNNLCLWLRFDINGSNQIVAAIAYTEMNFTLRSISFKRTDSFASRLHLSDLHT